MYYMQERQLSLSLLCCYLPCRRNPLTHPCALHNVNTLRHILMIFVRNEEEERRVECKRQLSLSSLCSSPLKLKSYAGHNSHTV